MSDTPPIFRYHPDPIATGSVVLSPQPCGCCGLVRGYLYVGPIYSAVYDGEPICPECVGDGTAAARFQAEFTDAGWGVPEDVPDSVLDDLCHRTPSFSAWQQDHWLYHCGDACAYLGRVGRVELEGHPDALDMLIHESDGIGWTPEQSRRFVDSLAADGEATAHLFRCLTCGSHLAYSDAA